MLRLSVTEHSYYNVIGYIPHAVLSIYETYFITGSVCFLILFPFSAHPSGNHQFVLYIQILFVSVLFVIYFLTFLNLLI